MSISIKNEHFEQQVGTNVYRTSVADMQTRAIPVSRVLATVPTGPTQTFKEGEYCLVGDPATPSNDAGLYVVNNDRTLSRLRDFAANTPLVTPVAALDLSTGDMYSLLPNVYGANKINSDALTISKIPTPATTTSLVTYANTRVNNKTDATDAGVRYLVDNGTNSADCGVWIGGPNNNPVRAQDTDFVFEQLLVLVTDTGNQYRVTTTTNGKPTDVNYSAQVSLEYSVDMEYKNQEVDYVVPFLSQLNIDELKDRIGMSTITSTLTVLVLVGNGADNGVYLVKEAGFSRPPWWGGDMHNTVVYDKESKHYYQNVARGRIDQQASLWIVILKPHTANRVYVTTVMSTDTNVDNLQDNQQGQPGFVTQSGLQPDFAIICDTNQTPTQYRIFDVSNGFVEWQVDDFRTYHRYVFVNIYAHSNYQVGDAFGLSENLSDPLLIPVAVSRESMLHCDRAVVYSTDPSDSVTSGALTVKGGVGVEGDVHANSLYADCDVRLKRDIRRIEGALDIVGALGAYEFSYREEHRGTHRNNKRRKIGVMAHEVCRVAPGATKVTDTGHLAVDTQQLIPLLVACVNEIQAKLRPTATSTSTASATSTPTPTSTP